MSQTPASSYNNECSEQLMKMKIIIKYLEQNKNPNELDFLGYCAEHILHKQEKYIQNLTDS